MLCYCSSKKLFDAITSLPKDLLHTDNLFTNPRFLDPKIKWSGNPKSYSMFDKQQFTVFETCHHSCNILHSITDGMLKILNCIDVMQRRFENEKI